MALRDPPALLREPAATAVGAARTAARLRRIALRRGGLALVVALFLAVSGAFGMAEAPFGRRLGYWVAAIGGGTVIGLGLDRVVTAWRWPEGRPWAAGVVRSLLIAAPVTLLAWGLAVAIFPGNGFDVAALPDFLLPVAVITACMVALTTVVDRQPPVTHAAPPPMPTMISASTPLAVPRDSVPPPPIRARLPDRLPPKLRGAALIAVEAEDHYLRLHTDRGSDLVLLRMADALVELDGLEGAQVHRSWWVARDAVVGVAREDGRVALLLTGGLQAPVSRTYVKALRVAGWFDPLAQPPSAQPGVARKPVATT